MKILMLTPYLPYPLLSGGQIRTYNLLKKLARKHDITLFALIKNETEKQYIAELEKYCAKVKVFKRSEKPFTPRNIFKAIFSTLPFLVARNHVPETISAIRAELSAKRYDLIHAETFYMMPHLPKNNIPTILAEQTIEYLGYESYAKKAHPLLRSFLTIDVQKIKKWERHYWRLSDKLIVMSAEDKKFIGRQINQDSKIKVVANGVDSAWFDEMERKLPTRPTVLSVGTFNWLPNVEAVDFLVQKIWPQLLKLVPNARLVIVGNAPTKKVLRYGQHNTSITVLGKIADIRTAFKQSHVLVAPVFSGKGTRYKILEAMASGTPVVASKIAVEGLGVKLGTHLLASSTAKTMAQDIAKLLNNRQLWQKLSVNGQRFVQQNFDWQSISQKLDMIYQTLGKKGTAYGKEKTSRS
ncbi:MAG TPA: glycosyltransferase family 4 protein [Patescibacteria group bacterium]|jgi:glycosyltransferase involved in cell wall biosynthesis